MSGCNNARLVAVKDLAIRANTSRVVGNAHSSTTIMYCILAQRRASMIIDVNSAVSIVAALERAKDRKGKELTFCYGPRHRT